MPHQLVVLDDDDVNRKLRLKLDLVQRVRVGRVGNGNRQAIAALAERQDAQRTHQLLVDDVLGQLLDVNRGQVEQCMPERVGSEFGNHR